MEMLSTFSRLKTVKYLLRISSVKLGHRVCFFLFFLKVSLFLCSYQKNLALSLFSQMFLWLIWEGNICCHRMSNKQKDTMCKKCFGLTFRPALPISKRSCAFNSPRDALGMENKGRIWGKTAHLCSSTSAPMRPLISSQRWFFLKKEKKCWFPFEMLW